MNIAIDASPLQNGHSMRGTGSYTHELIESLERYFPQHAYTFFVRGQIVPENSDIVHYPYFDPFFLTLPVIRSKPTVVTVHDLIPLVYPEHFLPGIRGITKWQIQRMSLRTADAVITDSNASKKDIHKVAGIENEKIHVVPLAPAPCYRRIEDKKGLQKVKEKYRLPDVFVLYVGDVNWNKNISGLLNAFSILNTKYETQNSTRLVLVGKAFLDEKVKEIKEINRLIDSLGLKDAVMKLGFVPDEDLVSIYNLARVTLQVSFAEGFGLPVLEAMASGCPVVTSNSSSLAEIAGPSFSVDPGNPEEIAVSIETLVQMEKDAYTTLSEKGIIWARRYTWKLTAGKTAEVYENTLRHHSGL